MVTGSGDVMDQQREKSLTMDDLYGEGKAYPDPYNAGERLLDSFFIFKFLPRFGFGFSYNALCVFLHFL